MKSPIEEKMIQSVKETIDKHGMLVDVKKVLIAFSSGPDSVCLLDTLHSLYSKRIEFQLIYVNHGLRPKRVLKKEETLTKKYAVKYNINYKITYLKLKKKKLGLEASARMARYKTLLHYMNGFGAQRIALGHNLDDVLETFFINLLRGSGALGLMSIPAVRLPFIRPLIDLKKVEILNFLKQRKLPYSLDRTNWDLKFRRNLLRHKIITQLIKINPNLHETIKREIEILKKDDAYLEKLAEKAYQRSVKRGKNYIALDLKRILHYNSPIINRVVIRVIKELRGDLEGYENKHFEGIISLKDKQSGKKIVLPKGLYAQREYGCIVIGFTEPVEQVKWTISPKVELIIPKRLIFRTCIVKHCDFKKLKTNKEVFDLEKLEPPLFIRNRRRGDYINTKIGKKKLKKIFNEFKISPHKRNEIMMLCDQKGILWILGIARAFRGFIDKKTKKILVAEFENIN